MPAVDPPSWQYMTTANTSTTTSWIPAANYTIVPGSYHYNTAGSFVGTLPTAYARDVSFDPAAWPAVGPALPAATPPQLPEDADMAWLKAQVDGICALSGL